MSGRRRPAARLDGPLTRELELAPSALVGRLVPRRLSPDGTAATVCGYCSTGCGLEVHLRDGRAVNLAPDRRHPVNRGFACPKGWDALTPLAAADRATQPLLRDGRGTLRPVSWPKAAATMVERFRDIGRRHGPDAVAFLSTGQITTEEMAFLGALAKFGMGMVHGDGNTRQCMATAVVAYKEAFGFDAPPYTYADFEASDVIVLWGSNLCVAHPIMWERVRRNARGAEVVVVDPRSTETAMAAGLHLALRPKTDLVLAYGLARLLIDRGWIDEAFVAAHTNGFGAFAAHVDAFTLDRVSGETGVRAAHVERLAELIGTRERTSLWWTMGINQSHEGVRTAQALIGLALMTGNIGRPGTGANSITGQCNAMGSRLFSNTTSLLGGRDFGDPAHRREVANILALDEARIPPSAGRAYDQILAGILAGTIRGLWIIGTNPAHSWINQRDLEPVLSRLDFLVVQDMYRSTETAARADLLLPAAGWGEKEGTFINSERRIGRVARVGRSPGEALSDFAIFRLLADAWGCAELFRGWESPARVFELLKELSRGRPCDFSGIGDYAQLTALGGVQWPCPGDPAAAASERRLFEDGRFFHPDGRARFVFDAPRPLPERPSRHHPFLLLTGRGDSAQWHTQTRTGKSAILTALAAREIYVEINPEDARRLGLRSHEWVSVESPRGGLRARALLTPAVAPGQVFIPMHYAVTNRLTFPAFDPHSRQPAYKVSAVRLRRLAGWE